MSGYKTIEGTTQKGLRDLKRNINKELNKYLATDEIRNVVNDFLLQSIKRLKFKSLSVIGDLLSKFDSDDKAQEIHDHIEEFVYGGTPMLEAM